METLRERYALELARRGYQRDSAQQAALDRMESLRQRILDGKAHWTDQLPAWLRPRQTHADPRGLYLWGGVGRGKTWLMDLFCASLPADYYRRVHFHHFMQDIHAGMRMAGRRHSPIDLVASKLAQQLRVLCLDELFVSDIADAMILGQLFAALLRHGVYLVITSNLPPSDLYKDGLQRARFLPAIQLLQSRLELIQVDNGVDYRLRVLSQQPIYLNSSASDVAAQMSRLFTDMNSGFTEVDPILDIQGHPLRAMRCGAGVVWFDFHTLCETARSQLDYMQIAREFHTVFVSDVPVFGNPSQDDAARRFIALVDEFYDQGVKLVLSAAAGPERLYPEGRLQFPFQRTASRLAEMCTNAYLSRQHRAMPHASDEAIKL